MALEIRAAFEQAEAVLHLPVDGQPWFFALREGRSAEAGEGNKGGKEGGRCRNGWGAHLGPQFEAAHLVARIRRNWERFGAPSRATHDPGGVIAAAS